MVTARRVMVRYTVKPGHEEQNEALARAVYDELAATQPPGLRYATFKLDDGRTFVHLASAETADGSNPLPNLPAFKRFQADFRDRCEDGPTFTDLTEIGSFRIFGDQPTNERGTR
jgi:hypothetical protein